MKNHVFGGLRLGRRKPTCSATETSYSLELLDLARLDIILPRQRTTKALIGLRRCAGCGDVQADLRLCCSPCSIVNVSGSCICICNVTVLPH